MRISGPGPIISKLVDTVSKNGTLLLNLSPKPDGTFPPEIRTTLLAIGDWLGGNGEAIYDTHNWIKFGEGGGTQGPTIRFTVKGEALYAIILGKWPGGEVNITSLGSNESLTGDVKSIQLFGSLGFCAFTRDASGLRVALPATAPGKYAYVLKITGLKMNPALNAPSGNPI